MTLRSSRLHGLDLARGLAIIGMASAHFAEPGTVLNDHISGYPSTLFAVLAGVSLALMVDRGENDPVRVRFSLLFRGVVLFGIGKCLQLVPVVAEALTAISLIYILLFWLPARSAKTVWITAAIFGILSPIFQVIVPFASPYPPLTWLAYGSIGVGSYQFLRAYPKKLTQALGISAGLAVVMVAFREINPFEDNDSLLLESITAHPHTGNIGDIICTGAVALATLFACVWLAHSASMVKLSLPVRSIGQMALTVYVLHVLTAGFYLSSLFFSSADEETALTQPPFEDYQAMVAETNNWDEYYDADTNFWLDFYAAEGANSADDGAVGEALTPPEEMDEYKATTHWTALGITVLVAMVGSSVWLHFFRRGPLEGALAWLIRVVTRPDPPSMGPRKEIERSEKSLEAKPETAGTTDN